MKVISFENYEWAVKQLNSELDTEFCIDNPPDGKPINLADVTALLFSLHHYGDGTKQQGVKVFYHVQEGYFKLYEVNGQQLGVRYASHLLFERGWVSGYDGLIVEGPEDQCFGDIPPDSHLYIIGREPAAIETMLRLFKRVSPN